MILCYSDLRRTRSESPNPSTGDGTHNRSSPLGVPDGFFRAAGEIYEALAGYKDTPDMPSVAEVAKALAGRRPV